MSEFDDLEASVENSAPREGIEIRHGVTVHRIATGARDIQINGNTFKAATGDRDAINVALLKEDSVLSVLLPTSHAFVQRYFQQGLPPRISTCTIWRKQMNSGETRRLWHGVVEACEIDGHIAKFRVPDTLARIVKRKLPVITVGRACPYVLYGAGCRVARAGFRVATTVTFRDGRTLEVASLDGHPNNWAQFGELVHLASGERMTIAAQTGTTIVLQLPILELRDGDSVHVFAGCNHDVSDCRDKFGNLPNYGGAPELPRGNIFLPNGYGIYQSE